MPEPEPENERDGAPDAGPRNEAGRASGRAEAQPDRQVAADAGTDDAPGGEGGPPASDSSSEVTVVVPGRRAGAPADTDLYTAGARPPGTPGPGPTAEGITGQDDLDSRLAALAVESGMATTAVVRACLDLADRSRQAGTPRPLADIFVERRVLEEDRVNALLAIARKGSAAKIIGGYELIEKVGEGGMGAVYKARQMSLDRIVALKIMSERVASDTEFVNRFVRETKVAAKLDHPNIVRAVDAGRAGGKFFFAMELVEGQSLEGILEKRGKLPEEEALGLAIQTARGLECAWRNQLIHRDIKPDNLLVTSDGVAKITDLGLAREVDADRATRLTQDGAAMGTPHYMSPEQARGEDVDIRTDIYSLGVTLYRALTGEYPFTGNDPVSVIMARFHQTPKPANDVDSSVSDDVAQVVATMMCADLEYRYPDPVVLLHDLELVVAGNRPEFAGGNKSARLRAIEAAQARASSRTTIGPVVVPRRRRRDRRLAAVGLVVAAAAVAAALVLGLRGFRAETGGGAAGTHGGAGRAVPAAVDPAKIAAERARRELEAEAAAFLEEMSGVLEAGRHAEVVTRIEASGDRYATTPSGPGIESLRLRAVAEMESAARRAEEEARREKLYRELVKRAREELAASEHERATDLLLQAKAVRDTEEVASLLQEAKRLQHLARAESAVEEGRLDEAARLLELALAIRDEPEARARLDEVRRRIALAAKLEEADGEAARGAFEGAREAYLAALELATEDEARGIRPRLESVEGEMRYGDALVAARALEAEGRWKELLDVATAASRMKPDAEEPKRLVVAARRGLGPDKEILDSIGAALALVPAGGFVMGSNGGQADEGPVHRVRLDSFYIGRFEVTNAQYEQFDPKHRRTEFSPDDDMPAVGVSWDDAVAFCRWLSRKEGIEYRLPTEAEWEYAARGASPAGRGLPGRRFPWGNEEPGAGGEWRCNVAAGREQDAWAADGHRYVAPAGSCPAGASPFGIHDLAGNVWEWCLDWYRSGYYSEEEVANPTGPRRGKQRVLRGGSFANGPSSARCANRTAHEPGFVEASVGFRVVRALDPIFRED